MKKLLALTAISLPALIAGASQRLVPVSTFNTQIIIGVDSAAAPSLVYYGPAVRGDLRQAALAALQGERQAAYPVYGNYPEGESALSVTMPDGNMTLDLIPAGEPKTECDHNGNSLTTIPLADRHYPVSVTLNYLAYPKEDVIETWADITNNGKKPVTMTRFESGTLPFRSDNA